MLACSNLPRSNSIKVGRETTYDMSRLDGVNISDIGADSAAGRPRTPYMRLLEPDTQPLPREDTILQKEKASTTIKVVAVQDGLTPTNGDFIN